MEERIPSPTDENQISLHHDPDPKSAFRSGNYVVQVPRDQIYRIPPPENALIVDRHRNPDQKTNKPRFSRFFCCFIFLAVLVLIAAIIAVLCTVLLKQTKDPKFSVDRFLVEKTKNSYRIRLKVENPNGNSGIWYKQGGVVSILFKKREIATGKFPSFDQGHNNSTVLGIVLEGKKEIEKSKKISLSVKVNVEVKMKVNALRTGNAKFEVECNLVVNTLSKDTRMLSQECSQRKL